ncbi:MAG TPA: glycoside hydrolase family 31 protein [Blastocatellia bacterium]|nr:glycoside hydrolase family 31 protein [Blastocatellia bacterium]HMZ19075.1 glycoside hydrolase family 31 protein [Blastocatellia bacterium]HNG32896.1 glycoside hydrolase family 31 protein [Blastocatellia bacterium]
MTNSISRRKALKNLGAAGAGALLASPIAGQDTAIQITGKPVEIALASVSPQTLRLTIAALENGQPRPVSQDGSLAEQRRPAPVARLTTLAQERTVRCGALNVKLSPSPLTIRIEAADGRLVQQLRVDAQTGALTFQIGDKPVLAFGQGGPQFDRRGETYTNRNGQGGYKLRTHGGRVPVQWLIGTGGWAMFVHHPYGAFDLTGAEGKLTPRVPDRPESSVAGALAGSEQGALPLDVFIVAAREPAQVMAEYARLTGKPELPPLWSFGYLQSHRTLAGPEEIRWVARTMREKQLPCDALIYLGTDFTPSGWNTHNGEFTFHPKNFPEPKKQIDELRDQHFKVVLHTVIEGRKLTGKVTDACTAALLPSGRTPDGKWPDNRQVACYWPVHKSLYDVGIDGWWPDQGDGLDQVSRLARIRMYYEGSQALRPNQRVFALHRNGQAGMQRFAAFLWSGDVYSTWETLKTHVPIAVNTGLTGIPWWGTDIGGFVPTKEYTGELHVRWFQFGAFCPLFRAHGRTWHLRLPWGWNTGELGHNEISNYTGGAANPDLSELRNASVEPICKKYLELRYRMMPYLYSAVRETYETGLPVMRALWLHYPDDATAVARGDEYLWGRDVLVAPVVEKGATSRSLYLPRGDWYDFWTEEKLGGGREISKAVDLATMPLYVRAGAILPLDPVRQYTAEKVTAPTTLVIYPGADGAFTLYEDDGATFNYRRGEFTKLQINWNNARRTLSLRPAGGAKAPGQRKLEIRLVGEKTSRQIVFAGRPVEIKL